MLRSYVVTSDVVVVACSMLDGDNIMDKVSTHNNLVL